MMVANLSLIAILLPLVGSILVAEDPENEHVRYRRQAVSDRPGCQPGATPPATRVDTTARLAALRALFSSVPGGAIHGYIVFSRDAHSSEYPADYDLRRGFISGFSGSAGTAAILSTQAALWTDGRYHLEGEETLDCNWIFMKQGLPDVPSLSDWLITQLNSTSEARVGVNPFLISTGSWKYYADKLLKWNITLVGVDNDLIDQIWTTGRPDPPNSPINALPMEYAGQTWQSKVADVRAQFETAGAYVVTSLDETAWLFNLRASDIAYNPFFISYAIVETNRVRLYLLNHTNKLSQPPTDPATQLKVHQHLNTGSDGSCAQTTGLCVEVLPYSSGAITDAMTDLASSQPDKKVWVSHYCSQAIYSAIPEAQRLLAKSAIALMKAKKNAVEREGMRASHRRDAAALIKFLAMLEADVKQGGHWTEVSAARSLKEYRMREDLNRGLSFPSIAGSGSNGAVIHYRPTPATDKQITTSDVFLLDSGGQYLDGTTDVTRTFHFGVPSDYEKECYTRVLMGHIDLAKLKWTKGKYGRNLDIVARAPLLAVGLDYRHGTGHGIGMYLSVHEGPFSLSTTSDKSVYPEGVPLDEHMFISDEPGYYEDGKFGIRLETVFSIEVVDTKYKFPGTTFLGFRATTLVPYEPHLIDFSLLNREQMAWLNAYHKQCEEEVGPLLTGEALRWLRKRTTPIYINTNTNAAGHVSVSSMLMLIICLLSAWISM